MVVTLVRLDRLTIEASGRLVPGCLAELDELAVLHDGDRLPGELTGGDALHGGSETVEVLEERAIPLGERIEGPRVEAHLGEPLGHQTVVLGLVSHLSREGELDVQLRGGDEPPGRDLRGLDLVLKGDLEQVDHGQVALDLGLERRLGREPAEELLVARIQVPDEAFSVHPVPPA